MALDKETRVHEAEVHLAHAIVHEQLGNADMVEAELARAIELEGPVKPAKVKKHVKKIAKKLKKAADKVVKKVAKSEKAAKKAYRKSPSKRAFGGHSDTHMWMCEKCGSLFKSKTAVEAHEAKHRGTASFSALTVKPHKALTKKCKWCGRWHTKGQHHSHGKDSFMNTHPGLFEDYMED